MTPVADGLRRDTSTRDPPSITTTEEPNFFLPFGRLELLSTDTVFLPPTGFAWIQIDVEDLVAVIGTGRDPTN